MRPEREERLYTTYPRLLAELRERYPADSVYKGIDCGDGWFDLVDVLCARIQERIDSEGLEQVKVKRIKEKFGTLRFIIFAQGDENIRGMIDLARALSERICERCGAPGVLRRGPIATLCEAHWRESLVQDNEVDADVERVRLLASYGRTFTWLQRYDDGALEEPSAQIGGRLSTLDEVRRSIAALKEHVLRKGEAGPLFGQERGDGLAAILGNLDLTVFGNAAYPSVESKAAHLLYFVVKDHPLSDGNKRSAALLFVDFLSRSGRLFGPDGSPVFNDVGLAALTLLVAESEPKDKDMLIRLIMSMLA